MEPVWRTHAGTPLTVGFVYAIQKGIPATLALAESYVWRYANENPVLDILERMTDVQHTAHYIIGSPDYLRQIDSMTDKDTPTTFYSMPYSGIIFARSQLPDEYIKRSKNLLKRIRSSVSMPDPLPGTCDYKYKILTDTFGTQQKPGQIYGDIKNPESFVNVFYRGQGNSPIQPDAVVCQAFHGSSEVTLGELMSEINKNYAEGKKKLNKYYYRCVCVYTVYI
eukprot:GHVR01127639.1.p1 GENE.GHVR01127639.1~~GHVR01127639.1.p1  ORF type:complete len:242 (-),score=18.67 GHVR01127639.1:62-730(-)